MFGNGSNCRYPRAASCDGVLFLDPEADGTLSQKREYVFTEWDPTAATDMEALRAYFDSNGDGKLTAADTAFANFKVLVTNADGSTAVATLTQLGITEINLPEDSTRIVLPRVGDRGPDDLQEIRWLDRNGSKQGVMADAATMIGQRRGVSSCRRVGGKWVSHDARRSE